MREDDYTGSLIGDDEDPIVAADVDLYEFDADDEALADEFASLAEREELIDLSECADGAKSLREIADALYDYADELIDLSENGWEIVDDVRNGHATAVQFAALEDE